MSYTKQLHQLQQIDTQMLARAIRLRKIEASLVESEALKTAKEVAQEADETFSQARATATDIELEVKGLQQRIQENEQKLYSGKVTSPKEAGSLQEEVDSSKRWLEKREEDLIEAMIHFEEAEADLEKKQEILKGVQAQWETDQFDLLQEQEDRKAELIRLKASREKVAPFIKKDDLANYERLRKKMKGVGLAEVKAGTCQSCGVMLSSGVIQQARADSQLHYCDSCKRIIHIL